MYVFICIQSFERMEQINSKNEKRVGNSLEVKPFFHIDTGLWVDRRILIAVVNELANAARCADKAWAHLLRQNGIDSPVMIDLLRRWERCRGWDDVALDFAIINKGIEECFYVFHIQVHFGNALNWLFQLVNNNDLFYVALFEPIHLKGIRFITEKTLAESDTWYCSVIFNISLSQK